MLGRILVEWCWEDMARRFAVIWARHPWPRQPGHCTACLEAWRDDGMPPVACLGCGREVGGPGRRARRVGFCCAACLTRRWTA